MTTYLITLTVIFLLRTGAFLATKPGPKVGNNTTGDLLISALISAAFAGWGLYLLIP